MSTDKKEDQIEKPTDESPVPEPVYEHIRRKEKSLMSQVCDEFND
jgi:hypothetical protein